MQTHFFLPDLKIFVVLLSAPNKEISEKIKPKLYRSLDDTAVNIISLRGLFDGYKIDAAEVLYVLFFFNRLLPKVSSIGFFHRLLLQTSFPFIRDDATDVPVFRTSEHKQATHSDAPNTERANETHRQTRNLSPFPIRMLPSKYTHRHFLAQLGLCVCVWISLFRMSVSASNVQIRCVHPCNDQTAFGALELQKHFPFVSCSQPPTKTSFIHLLLLLLAQCTHGPIQLNLNAMR